MKGCPNCGSTCGVFGCRVCSGKQLCQRCQHDYKAWRANGRPGAMLPLDANLNVKVQKGGK